jgi:hypothetical protein
MSIYNTKFRRWTQLVLIMAVGANLGLLMAEIRMNRGLLKQLDETVRVIQRQNEAITKQDQAIKQQDETIKAQQQAIKNLRANSCPARMRVSFQ